MAARIAHRPLAVREGRIASSLALDPFQQGEFDGLCGIYAVINGLRLLLEPNGPLGYTDASQLYQRGVDILRRDGRLAFGATWGISQSRWRRIVAALCSRASRITELAVYSAQPFPENKQHCRQIVFAAIEAAIDAQQPVLVALLGTYDHYTVICAYTPSRYFLHDSYAYRWICKASCGLTLDRGKWRHRIATRSIMILGVRP